MAIMETKDIRHPVPTNGGGVAERFGDTWKKQTDRLRQKLSSKLEEVRMPGDYPTDVPIVYIQKDSIVDVLRFMRDDDEFRYDFLSDITATDEYPSAPRFEVVYNLLSMSSGSRIRVKARLNEGEEIPTLVDLWAAANWAEREVWDMFGIKFTGHPDLRRILMDMRWEGHPLRKDYPLRGYQVLTSAEPIDEKLLED